MFDKHRKTLLHSHVKLADIAKQQSYSNLKGTEADCEIVMRMSETY